MLAETVTRWTEQWLEEGRQEGERWQSVALRSQKSPRTWSYQRWKFGAC